MGRRALLLPMLALLAVAYGLTRHEGTLAPAAPNVTKPDRGKQEASRNREAWGWATVPPAGQRVAFAERRPLVGTSHDAEWPDVPIRIESNELPIELGKPLGVNDDLMPELVLTQEEPIDVGTEADANDLSAWAPETPSEPPTEIGAPLDPEDLAGLNFSVADEESVEIGDPLDADDPLPREPDGVTGRSIEMGDFFDAGSPRVR
jgi:hypothetical protein